MQDIPTECVAAIGAIGMFGERKSSSCREDVRGWGYRRGEGLLDAMRWGGYAASREF
jgi:hypothetical protein